jgi:hypothetical protein
MRRHRSSTSLRLVVAGTLLGLTLTACDKPKPTAADEPAAVPAPAPSPASEMTSPMGDAPAPAVPPSDAPTGPAQPSPDAPPPADSSPAPKPTAASAEPALESMTPAMPSNAKIGVPVDVRYSFDSEVVPNQPVQLSLAIVPRVAGQALQVSVQRAEGVDFSEGTLSVQKASAAGVYRKQLAVTRRAGATDLKVLVTMGIAGGSGHGFYTIPFQPPVKNSQKQDSVKQR